MKSICVVPSCRPDCVREFIEAWKDAGDWDELVVVEDAPVLSDLRTTVLSWPIRRFCWADIDRTLGGDGWIVSRRDSAIRCFGFLMAYRLGATHVLTLDDDCFPHSTPIVHRHFQSLRLTPKWISTVPDLHVRGLPYVNRGHLSDVVASMGLWSHVPDLDGVQSLRNPLAAVGGFEPPPGRQIIPRGQYAPICGMNLFLDRRSVPLAYFPLMGEGQPYRRFDDIWFGVIFKKICDHLGWSISVGEPFIRHVRASDPLTNLEKEAPGIVANERFWETVDRMPVGGSSPTECMQHIGYQLELHKSDPYISRLGKAIQVWASLFT